ncbi:MAG TPA: hypothetical protein VML55_07455 [Planctomycetaceae bacterium]|nr:hypothetical protein [Planctomycetaceae bacterium]
MRRTLIVPLVLAVWPAITAGQVSFSDYDPDSPPARQFQYPPPDVAPLTPEPADWTARRQTGFTVSWLPGSGDDLGITSFDLYSTFAVGSNGLTVTPGGGIDLTDGPTSTDLPPRLYNLYLDVMWQKQVNDRFGFELALMPTWFSDFKQSDSDAFRLLGRAIGYYECNESTQLVLGVVYLDLGDVPWLPIAGLVWFPSEDVQIDLLFPRPRIGVRIERSECRDRWLYLAGEFGGGSWAIERVWGASDVATYSDVRLVAGLLNNYSDGQSWRAEIGYVFGRWLDYDSGLGNYDPDDTLMLRFGFLY